MYEKYIIQYIIRFSYEVSKINMKILIIILSLCSVSWCDELPTVEKFFKKFGRYGE